MRLVIAAALLFAATIVTAQEQPLPGETDDRINVLAEHNQQLSDALVINAARARAQKREIDRQLLVINDLRKKCGDPCKEPDKPK